MQVGIGKCCDHRELQAALAAYFPAAPVCVYPDWDIYQEFGPEGAIIAIMYSNLSEFPIMLEVYPDPEERQAIYRMQLSLAKFLSNRLGCRTICDGTEHGDSDAPYWSVIWENGVPWLADDCGSIFADGEGGEVRLVRQLEIDG